MAGNKQTASLTCNREMQHDQKEDHFAGKQQIARAKRGADTDFEAVRPCNMAVAKTLRAPTVSMKNP